jgi:hypothetical protein
LGLLALQVLPVRLTAHGVFAAGLLPLALMLDRLLPHGWTLWVAEAGFLAVVAGCFWSLRGRLPRPGDGVDLRSA